MINSYVLPKAAIFITFGAIIGVSLVYLINMFRTKKKFQHVGKIKKILIYPVKSLAAIEVSEADCTKFGLQHDFLRDREFLIVDEKGHLISQREEPTLSLVKTSYSDGKLHIYTDDMRPLIIPLKVSHPDNIAIKEVNIFGQKYKSYDCGDEISMWFEEYLKKPGTRLVRTIYDENSSKPSAAFHDCTTFNVLSQSSVDKLNSKLKEKVSYKHFRPNLLIDGTLPNYEDYWKSIKVADAVLSFYQRCDRCVMTTVIPEKGIKTNLEPLKTLREYRVLRSEAAKQKYKLAPLFGTLLVLEKPGRITSDCDVYAYVLDEELI